ncbi:hypothetical protein B0H17DRAFT_262563 [Mycena rosella]|uniref:Uncharacterized protein n=1 Tax=Mycena rosella TaxID=1033263 RepID=A0AAD7CVP6_MYCRO|nr:hypothetical protein B0H17DRAFT_262563 [Mycena rosella]
MARLLSLAVIVGLLPSGLAGPACAQKHKTASDCMLACNTKWGFPGLMMGTDPWGTVMHLTGNTDNDWNNYLAKACSEAESAASSTAEAPLPSLPLLLLPPRSFTRVWARRVSSPRPTSPRPLPRPPLVLLPPSRPRRVARHHQPLLPPPPRPSPPQRRPRPSPSRRRPLPPPLTLLRRPLPPLTPTPTASRAPAIAATAGTPTATAETPTATAGPLRTPAGPAPTPTPTPGAAAAAVIMAAERRMPMSRRT